MAERRLPFTVQDDEGVPQKGEVIVVPAWRAGVRPSASATFTIILVEQPVTTGAPVSLPGVAVFAPASSTRLPPAPGETAAAYRANGGRGDPPLRLPKRTREAFARGALLSASELPLTASEVFANGTRLDDLARALVAAARRAERYWEAVDSVLSWPEEPARLPQPRRLRARLLAALTDLPPFPTVDRLRAIAEGAPPEEIEPSPGALAEDAAFARCVTAHPFETEVLGAMRAYVEAAIPAAEERELLVDHAATRERLSFVTLLSEPESAESMRAAFESFRATYIAAYERHHQGYWEALEKLLGGIARVQPEASALARLNTLRALGRPLGEAALRDFEELSSRAEASCGARDLRGALHDTPVCPECGLSMAAEAPADEAAAVPRRVRAALARQESRLANEAIRRILARGGERLEQFLKIVQASDQRGLARILDDDLLAFLRDLLAQPAAMTRDALELLDELARAHPTVGAGQVDEAVETLRALLARRTASGEVHLIPRPADS